MTRAVWSEGLSGGDRPERLGHEEASTTQYVVKEGEVRMAGT